MYGNDDADRCFIHSLGKSGKLQTTLNKEFEFIILSMLFQRYYVALVTLSDFSLKRIENYDEVIIIKPFVETDEFSSMSVSLRYWTSY